MKIYNLPTHEEHRLESFDDKGVCVLVPEDPKANGKKNEDGVEGDGVELQEADRQRECDDPEDQADQGKWEEFSYSDACINNGFKLLKYGL